MKKQMPLFLTCLVFLVSFGVYLRTLNPVFNADDSPETAASCATLGVQHPPGYPLHTLAGRLAALVPLASPGFRLNLMAAFFAALAVALLAWNIRLFLRGLVQDAPAAVKWLALILPASALLLAFSKTFWSQALSAKGGIYTLQACLLGALFLCLLKWEEDVSRRFRTAQSSRLRLLKSPWFLIACLLLGLGLGNHWETQILFFPPCLAFAFFLLKKTPLDSKLASGAGLWKPLAQGAALAALGLSVYALLPLRARLNPVMDWGHPADWKQFCWVLLRQEYTDIETGFIKSVLAALKGSGTWAEARSQFSLVAAQGARVAGNLTTELGLAGGMLSLGGAWLLFKKRRGSALAFCLGLAALFVLVVTFYFRLKPEMIWILDVFLLPAYMMLVFLAACGLLWLGIEISRRWPSPGSNGQAGKIPALILALLVGSSLRLNWGRDDQSGAYWAYDFGRDFLDGLKKDSLVFAEGDFFVMPIYYLQNIEGRRRDVIHLTDIFLSLPWGVEEVQRGHPETGLDLDPHSVPSSGPLFTASVTRLVERNQGRRPIECSIFHDVLREFYAKGEGSLSPSGLAQEYFAPSGRGADLRRIGLIKALRGRHWQAKLETLHPSTQFMLSNYASAYLELANHLRLEGKTAPANSDPYYKTALVLAPRQNRAEVWTHWGMALSEKGKPQQALEAFGEALKIKPLFEAWANMAGVYNGLKKYKEAAEAGKKAVELAPNSPEALNNLAIATFYLGDRPGAVAILEKAVSANPSNPSVANNLRALRGK